MDTALFSLLAVVHVLLWTWVSDGVRWRLGELVCPGRFLSASEVTAQCRSSQSSQDDVCRRARFRYASPRVKGAVYPPGYICPEGHLFLTCPRVLYYPGEPCWGRKSEARLHMATGAFASWARGSTCWAEASAEDLTNEVKISRIGSPSARNQGQGLVSFISERRVGL